MPTSPSRASLCSPSDSHEAGNARGIVILVALAILVFGIIRYSMGLVAVSEFAGAVRGVILSNPVMADAEAIAGVTAKAKAIGVLLDEKSLRVERLGSMGTISNIHVEYIVPIDMVLFTIQKRAVKDVEP